MRILHLMNIPITIDQLKCGGNRMDTSGGWMAALLGQMLKSTNHTFGCVSFGKVRETRVEHDHRLDTFVVPGKLAARDTTSTLEQCRRIVAEWQPDLLHVHGTEAVFGLLSARGMVECPAVISLQGLLGPYSEWYRYFGNLSILQIIRMHRLLEVCALRGQFMSFLKFRMMAEREKEIIQGNRFFIGRTSWDRAYIHSLNPSAHYYHGGELMRDAFWRKRWDISRARRNRIIFTNAGHPRKGTETLFDAVEILRSEFPDIEVAIAGAISRRNGYGRQIRKRMSQLGCAVELGQLSAEQMAMELLASHVFVSPSFIDNSPNAICEAQLLGMPVVATYTGGVPTLVEEGRTGLMVPTGDAPMLAARLKEVLKDDALSTMLGARAQDAALLRHDPDCVVQEILAVYDQVLLARSSSAKGECPALLKRCA